MPWTPAEEAQRDAIRRSMLAQAQEMTPDECRSMLSFLTGYCSLEMERGWSRGMEGILERRLLAHQRQP